MWGAFAQNEDLPVIDQVLIQGNKVVSRSLIKKQLRTQKGKVFSRIDINKDIKGLYQLNYFSHISVDVDEDETGFKVIFNLVEKPAIDKIIFEGNAKIKSKILRKQLHLNEGELLDEKVLAGDVVELKAFYEKKGYKQARIASDTKVNESAGLVDVVFKVEEGRKIKIKNIKILGAYKLKEKKVLRVMKTKRKKWYNSGLFEEAKFKEDLERIKAFYYQKGFVDIKIIDVSEILVAGGSKMIMEIEIDEGQRYVVSEIKMQGNQNFATDELMENTRIEVGDEFLPGALSEDVKGLKNFYLKNGYIDARIGVDTIASGENQGLLVIYNIIENEVAFVDRIHIIGNDKTKDKVVRRELNIRPGEKFDGVKMEVAQQRLSNLGLFKKVDIYADPTKKAKERDLFVELEEDRTGELSFGAGFSSVDNLIGFLEVTQSNFDLFNFPSFTGDAQKLRLRTEFGDRRKEFLLDFTEPWMFDKKLLFGFKVFSREQDFKNSDFSEDRKGVSLRLAKPLFKFSRGEVRYSFENVEVLNVSAEASEILKAQEGEREVGKIGLNLKRDVRNAFFMATRGSKITLDMELAGIAGDTEYYRVVYSQDMYFRGLSDHTLIVSFRVGGIEEYGASTEVPIFDRFFLGGPRSIRGFENRDVGPHDIQEEPLGGKFLYHGTFEYVVPLSQAFRVAPVSLIMERYLL